MFLIFIAFLVLIASVVIGRLPVPQKKVANGLRLTGGILLVVGVLTSSFVQINTGFVGVKSLFGRVQSETLSSGLSFVNPLVEVIQIETRTLNYTMSGIQTEGKIQGDDAIKVLTADGLEVTIDLSVLYRVVPDQAPRLIRETGSDFEDKIVRPITRTRIRDNAVYYEAVALYSTRRDEFQSRIFKSIENDFRIRGLFLENLLVRNISLPASVKAAIERKIEAEQEAQKMQFVLQKEKQEAERKRVEAQGIADYQQIISASLSDRQLQYEQIKAMTQLAGSANAKIIVMPSKGGAPLIIDGKN
ncbi:MAG: prohibitin family protein [Chitinophagaceae bacterium]|nr:prohibitin family protein [Chitinophagaceae bacterium]